MLFIFGLLTSHIYPPVMWPTMVQDLEKSESERKIKGEIRQWLHGTLLMHYIFSYLAMIISLYRCCNAACRWTIQVTCWKRSVTRPSAISYFEWLRKFPQLCVSIIIIEISNYFHNYRLESSRRNLILLSWDTMRCGVRWLEVRLKLRVYPTITSTSRLMSCNTIEPSTCDLWLE